MANLIDTTYFINEISLPIDEIGGELTSYITRYEKEILIKILGYDLYKAFITALEGYEPAEKWGLLRDGCDYEVSGITYNWPGLINTEKESLIAYYVFYQFSCHSSTFNSSVGGQIIKGENSISVDNRRKQVFAYNKMVDMISQMNDFIYYMNNQNNTNYPNYYPETIRKINIFNV